MSGEQSHFEHPFYRVMLPLVLASIPVYWGWQDHLKQTQTPESTALATSQPSKKSLDDNITLDRGVTHPSKNSKVTAELQPISVVVSLPKDEPQQSLPAVNVATQDLKTHKLIDVSNIKDINIHKPIEDAVVSVSSSVNRLDECLNPDIELRPLKCMEDER